MQGSDDFDRFGDSARAFGLDDASGDVEPASCREQASRQNNQIAG